MVIFLDFALIKNIIHPLFSLTNNPCNLRWLQNQNLLKQKEVQFFSKWSAPLALVFSTLQEEILSKNLKKWFSANMIQLLESTWNSKNKN